MQEISEKRSGKVKYDNRCQVSYPDSMYLEVRRWATKKGISIQDLQRRAVEFYLNHLNHDAIVFTQDDTNKRAKNSTDDSKRKPNYLR
jgi:hypothetical protein